MRIMQDSKGQNMVEYVLLVTAVMIVCIYFFTAHSGRGSMTQAINSSLNSIVNEIDAGTSKIQLQ